MKNTLLITKFFPPERGGIQSYLYNLVLNLPNDKIFVFTHRSPDESQRLSPALAKTPKFDQQQPLKIIRTNFQNWLRYLHLTTFYLFSKTKKIIKQEKIEKILCGHLPIAGPLAFFIKRTYNLPYFIFTHGLEIFSIKKLGKQRQGLFKTVMQEVEKIIATTDFMANYLKKEYGIKNEKIVKIPPGIDSKIFKPFRNDEMSETNFVRNNRFRFAQSVTPNTKIILTCGRLVVRKNHISVIRALPKIIKEIPNILYLITGQGPEEQNLKNEVKKLHLENYVKFLSAVSQEDLPALYNLAHIFVMPARDIPEKGDIEGFGVVFLEAAACGLPCIGGQSGGQGEAIENGKTGLLVNPESIDDVASAILKILKSPNLAKKMGETGRNRIIKQFNWKLQTDKLKNILE
jgi:phosphatidylinositol alpha-1,6-mannosyltransferase